MRVADMDWRMVEDWVGRDDRAVLPLGSTEQHAGLSLLTDAILAEKLAIDAAEPLGVPVFPGLPYGLTPQFAAFPGSVTLRVETFCALLRDVLDSLKRSGFRRIVLVNGHSGNHPAAALAHEWLLDNADCRVRMHDWWRSEKVLAEVHAIDPIAGHGSWVENFPWTRLAGDAEESSAAEAKPMVDQARLQSLASFEARTLLEDGCFGGRRRRSDDDMARIWRAAVQETRSLLSDW